MARLFVIKPRGQEFFGFSFEKAGSALKDAVFHETLSLRDLRGKRAIVLVDDPEVLYGEETLVNAPQEVLELQLRERVRNYGFTGEDLRLVYRVEERVENQVRVVFLAGTFAGFGEVFRRLVTGGVQVEGAVHQALALAAVAGFCADEAVLVAEARDDGVWLVAVQGGRPLYFRFEAADEFAGLSPAVVEDSLVSVLDYVQRVLRVDVEHLLALGPRREVVPLLEGRLKPLALECEGIGAPAEDLLREPAFFGAPFAPPDLDLAPPAHRLWLSQLRLARPVALALAALSLVGFGAWFHLHRRAEALEASVERLADEISRKSRELRRLLPPEEAETFRRFWDTYERFRREPRLDALLAWLAASLPPGATITSLDVKRGEGALAVSLEVSLSGSFGEVQRSFRKLALRLRERARNLKGAVSYSEEEGAGIFSCQFDFPPRAPVAGGPSGGA